MNTRARWIAVGVAVPLALIAATIAVALAWHDRLPDPVATHFGGARADGSMGFAASQAVPLGIAFAAVVIGALLCIAAEERFHPTRVTSTLVLGLVALLCATDVAALAWNLDADSWRDVAIVWWQFALAIAALPIGAVAGWFAFGRAPADEPVEPADAAQLPTVGLKEGERAAWTGSVSSHLMLVGAAVLTAALAVVGVAIGQYWLLAVALIGGFTVSAIAEVRVTVDSDGVNVRSWLRPLRWRHVPLARIESATAIDVEPMQWGGWGYRVLPGRGSAIVLRRGPGLRLDLDGGRAFVVTVDDPATAAGLVNDLRSRYAQRP